MKNKGKRPVEASTRYYSPHVLTCVYSSYACFGCFDCLHIVASNWFRHTLPLSKSITSYVPTLADSYSICLLLFCAHLGRSDVTLCCLLSPTRFTSFGIFAYCLRLASGVHSSAWFACFRYLWYAPYSHYNYYRYSYHTQVSTYSLTVKLNCFLCAYFSYLTLFPTYSFVAGLDYISCAYFGRFIYSRRCGYSYDAPSLADLTATNFLLNTGSDLLWYCRI